MSAVIISEGRVLTTLDFKRKLKEVFQKEYKASEINEALVEVQDLINRVIGEQFSDKVEEIYVFPDQYIEGT